ncbi:hypothetical protein V8G54_034787 [Vigna mungo]|uniref:Autophagy protein 5 n=1 Tax=Vigna mungo TaxID=3915 RepID=A0AAQ3MEI3_VIGMU
MSQPDQVELWDSVLKGTVVNYLSVGVDGVGYNIKEKGNLISLPSKGARVPSALVIYGEFVLLPFDLRLVSTVSTHALQLKLGTSEDEYTENVSSVLIKSPQSTGDTDVTGQVKTGRIPVRLYLWTVNEEFDDFEDAPQIDNWDKVSYINRPVELYKEDGKYFSLNDAVKRILPEFFLENSFVIEGDTDINQSGEEGERSSDPGSSCNAAEIAEIKFVRIQGIEPILDIPFSWVVNNLMNPEYFLHMCISSKSHRSIFGLNVPNRPQWKKLHFYGSFSPFRPLELSFFLISVKFSLQELFSTADTVVYRYCCFSVRGEGIEMLRGHVSGEVWVKERCEIGFRKIKNKRRKKVRESCAWADIDKVKNGYLFIDGFVVAEHGVSVVELMKKKNEGCRKESYMKGFYEKGIRVSDSVLTVVVAIIIVVVFAVLSVSWTRHGCLQSSRSFDEQVNGSTLIFHEVYFNFEQAIDRGAASIDFWSRRLLMRKSVPCEDHSFSPEGISPGGMSTDPTPMNTDPSPMKTDTTPMKNDSTPLKTFVRKGSRRRVKSRALKTPYTGTLAIKYDLDGLKGHTEHFALNRQTSLVKCVTWINSLIPEHDVQNSKVSFRTNILNMQCKSRQSLTDVIVGPLCY